MAINYVPLNNEKHRDLKFAMGSDFSYAANTHLAAATIREFAQLAGSMPLVFIQDPNTKNIHSVAMLGLEQGVNLYFSDNKWQAPHVPLNIQRYPFDIRPDGEKLGVFIDDESEHFVKEGEGEALFNDKGEPTEFLQRRQQFLVELANSEVQNQRFIKQLQELELLEDIELRVNYKDGASRNVTGMLSINEKKLLDLDDDKVLALHKAGYLGAIYSMMLSLGQLNRLVELSNKTKNPIQSMQISQASAQQASGQQAEAQPSA
ncbi:SapC family protein [Glaciecola sp. XM2]|uniref:SapC family protein n=1 Tax=Glaciecola sp. XM2 TaxID=1914931 RepID=UPI001BDF1EBB|nr:SapC family protein [Glaciecola sp. XM2]MBT1450502.1 SapC family protein [Glaciecola sp. XM2]